MSNVKCQMCKEQGATLILAIIILSSVTFLSFALATIIMREIKVAQNLAKTEPAISAASAGSEVGLYNYLRQTGSVNRSATSLPSSGASYDVSADFYEFPFDFSLQPSDGELEGGNYIYRYYLYDPEDFENSANLYGSMTIENTTSGRVIYYWIYSFDDLENHISYGSLNGAGTSPSIVLDELDDRYVIKLRWGNYSISGKIRTYDGSGQAKGVPTSNPTIESTGTNEGVERRMRVQF